MKFLVVDKKTNDLVAMFDEGIGISCTFSDDYDILVYEDCVTPIIEEDANDETKPPKLINNKFIYKSFREGEFYDCSDVIYDEEDLEDED